MEIDKLLKHIRFSPWHKPMNLPNFLCSANLYVLAITKHKACEMRVHIVGFISDFEWYQNRKNTKKLVAAKIEIMKMGIEDCLERALSKRMGIPRYRGYFKILRFEPMKSITSLL